MNNSVLSWLRKLAAETCREDHSGHWTRDSETARPVADQASPWKGEVTVNTSSPTRTAWVRPVIKDWIQDRTAPRMPNDVLRRSINILWSTVSKAADMSSKPSSHLVAVCCPENVRYNLENCSLSTLLRPVGQLKVW